METTTRIDEANSLIAELPLWNGGNGISAEDWIGCAGSFELAIGYSLVFWPTFNRMGSYIVIAGVSERAIRDWEGAGHSRSQIEAVLNHLHIVDMQAGVPPPTEAQVIFLGRTLKSIWEVKLAADFPDRSFEVIFDDTPGMNLTEYQITFCQRDNAPT